jgi:hypothetical protein
VTHSSHLLACVGRFDWTESPRGWFGVLLESARIQSPSPSRDVASWRKLSGRGVDSRSFRDVLKSAESFVRNSPLKPKDGLNGPPSTVLLLERERSCPLRGVCFFRLYPGLTSWAKLCRSSGAGPRRVAHSSRLLAGGAVRLDRVSAWLVRRFVGGPLGFNRRPLRVTLRRGESVLRMRS